MRVTTSNPSMRGISISSNITSGLTSSNCNMASKPSLAVTTSMPRRSSNRLVTLRTVTESSTTIATRWSRALSNETTLLCVATLFSERTNAAKSAIITTLPSPNTVAPAIPSKFANCAPRLLTTISRLAISRSTCKA